MSWKDWFSDPGAACAPPPLPPDSIRLDKPRVIVLERGRLSEDEIRKAFAGNAGALWYQALVSKLESVRDDNLMEASRSASADNHLGMAGGLNVYEALSGILMELDQYANSTKE